MTECGVKIVSLIGLFVRYEAILVQKIKTYLTLETYSIIVQIYVKNNTVIIEKNRSVVFSNEVQ